MYSLRYNQYYDSIDIIYKQKRKSIYDILNFKNISFTQSFNDKMDILNTNKDIVQLYNFIFCYLFNMKFFFVDYKKIKQKNITINNCFFKFKFSNKLFYYFLFEFLNHLLFEFLCLNKRKNTKKINYLLEIELQNFNFYLKKLSIFSKKSSLFLLNFNIF